MVDQRGKQIQQVSMFSLSFISLVSALITLASAYHTSFSYHGHLSVPYYSIDHIKKYIWTIRWSKVMLRFWFLLCLRNLVAIFRRCFA